MALIPLPDDRPDAAPAQPAQAASQPPAPVQPQQAPAAASKRLIPFPVAPAQTVPALRTPPPATPEDMKRMVTGSPPPVRQAIPSQMPTVKAPPAAVTPSLDDLLYPGANGAQNFTRPLVLGNLNRGGPTAESAAQQFQPRPLFTQGIPTNDLVPVTPPPGIEGATPFTGPQDLNPERTQMESTKGVLGAGRPEQMPTYEPDASVLDGITQAFTMGAKTTKLDLQRYFANIADPDRAAAIDADKATVENRHSRMQKKPEGFWEGAAQAAAGSAPFIGMSMATAPVALFTTYAQGTGNLLGKLEANGVDPDVALVMAHVGGFVYGMIERAQAAIPGMKGLGGDVADRVAKKVMERAGSGALGRLTARLFKYGTYVGMETFEETGQEISDITTEVLAAEIHEQIGRPGTATRPDLKEAGSRVLENTKGGFGASLILGPLTGGVNLNDADVKRQAAVDAVESTKGKPAADRAAALRKAGFDRVADSIEFVAANADQAEAEVQQTLKDMRSKGIPDEVGNNLMAAHKAVISADTAESMDKALDAYEKASATATDWLKKARTTTRPPPIPMPGATQASTSTHPTAPAQPTDPAAAAVKAAADKAATSPANDLAEPTEAQKAAGNYQKGHTRVAGLDISIENPAGSQRNPDWSPLMDHYGYVKGTEGHDGDQVDVFINPDHPESDKVYVVDQVDPKTGKFDEHKAIMGARSQAEAESMYDRNYTPDWKGRGRVRAFTQDEFKAWLKRPPSERGTATTEGPRQAIPTTNTTPPVPAQGEQPPAGQEPRGGKAATKATMPQGSKVVPRSESGTGTEPIDVSGWTVHPERDLEYMPGVRAVTLVSPDGKSQIATTDRSALEVRADFDFEVEQDSKRKGGADEAQDQRRQAPQGLLTDQPVTEPGPRATEGEPTPAPAGTPSRRQAILTDQSPADPTATPAGGSAGPAESTPSPRQAVKTDFTATTTEQAEAHGRSIAGDEQAIARLTTEADATDRLSAAYRKTAENATDTGVRDAAMNEAQKLDLQAQLRREAIQTARQTTQPGATREKAPAAPRQGIPTDAPAEAGRLEEGQPRPQAERAVLPRPEPLTPSGAAGVQPGVTVPPAVPQTEPPTAAAPPPTSTPDEEATARAKAGKNPRVEGLRIPTTKVTKPRPSPLSINGTKGAGIENSAQLRGLYAALARWGQSVADLFAGGGVVDLFMAEEGHLKGKQHIMSEWEPLRAIAWRRITGPTYQEVITRAETMMRGLVEMMAKADAIVAGASGTNMGNNIMAAVREYLMSVPDPSGGRVTAEAREKAAARVADLYESYFNAEHAEATKDGGAFTEAAAKEASKKSVRRQMLRWWAEVMHPTTLAPGQDLEAIGAAQREWGKTLSDMSALAEALSPAEPKSDAAKKHLPAVKAARGMVEKRVAALKARLDSMTVEPPALNDDDHTAAVSVTLQWAMGSQSNAQTQLNDDGSLRNTIGIGVSVNPNRIDTVLDAIRKAHDLLQGADVRRADSWKLIGQLAPGTSLVVDPSYFGKGRKRDATSNYGVVTEIKTPEDLLHYVDAYLLPAWGTGSRMVITNTWDPWTANQLQLRGFNVSKFQRSGKEDELVAWNFQPDTGTLFPKPARPSMSAQREGEANDQPDQTRPPGPAQPSTALGVGDPREGVVQRPGMREPTAVGGTTVPNAGANAFAPSRRTGPASGRSGRPVKQQTATQGARTALAVKVRRYLTDTNDDGTPKDKRITPDAFAEAKALTVDEKAHTLANPVYKAISDFANAIGKEVLFVKNLGTNGLVNPQDPTVLLVRTQSDTEGIAEATIVATAFHELVETLYISDRVAFDAMADRVMKLASGWDQWKKKAEKWWGRVGTQELRKEMIADALGEIMTTPAMRQRFMRELSVANRGLLRQIQQILIALRDRVMALMPELRVSQYFSDFNSVIDELAAFVGKAHGTYNGDGPVALSARRPDPLPGWTKSHEKPGHIVGWRGERFVPTPENQAKNTGATEGVGLYVAKDKSLASQFVDGKPRRVVFPAPKNPILVDYDNGDGLYILQETDDIMAPPSESDSPWLAAHKEAVRRTGTTDDNWGQNMVKLQRALTDVLQERGYDAVHVKAGDEWVVLLAKPGQILPFSPRRVTQDAQITTDYLSDLLDRQYQSPSGRKSDEQLTLETYEENRDKPWVADRIAQMNATAAEVDRLMADTPYNRGDLLDRIATRDPILDYDNPDGIWPIPVYVSADGDENTVGLLLHRDGKKEMFEGNDEATGATLDLVNQLLGVGDKMVTVWTSQPIEIVQQIRSGTIPDGIYVSPSQQHASGYWGDGRELVRLKIPMNRISQESDVDWKVRTPSTLSTEQKDRGSATDQKTTLQDEPPRFSVAGRRAATADIAALSVANDMQKRGESRRTIWDKTGWWTGPDGKWRFEIPDYRNLKVTSDRNEWAKAQSTGTPLSRFISHPKLFRAYPFLNGVTVLVDDIDSQGSWSASEKTIRINYDLPLIMKKLALIHEIQHAIQHIEGLAKGASRFSKLTKAERQKLKEIGHVEDQAYDLSAGEAEARMMELRSEMTATQRENEAPFETLDRMLHNDGNMPRTRTANDYLLVHFSPRRKPTPRFVTSWKDLTIGKAGAGFFILPDGRLLDISNDFFDGGTNDHVGFIAALDNPDLVGVSKATIDAAKAVNYEALDDDGSIAQWYDDLWNDVREAGVFRARLFPSERTAGKMTVAVEFIQPGRVGLRQLQDLILNNQVPSGPNVTYMWESTGDDYGSAKGSESVLQARSFRDLKQPSMSPRRASPEILSHIGMSVPYIKTQDGEYRLNTNRGAAVDNLTTRGTVRQAFDSTKVGSEWEPIIDFLNHVSAHPTATRQQKAEVLGRFRQSKPGDADISSLIRGPEELPMRLRDNAVDGITEDTTTVDAIEMAKKAFDDLAAGRTDETMDEGWFQELTTMVYEMRPGSLATMQGLSDQQEATLREIGTSPERPFTIGAMQAYKGKNGVWMARKTKDLPWVALQDGRRVFLTLRTGLEARRRAMQEAPQAEDDGVDMPFSPRRSTVTPEQDAAYMKAVEAGDTATAQRMVDEAARVTGLRPEVVYHGSPSHGFHVFNRSRATATRDSGFYGSGIYFTDNKGLADKYALKKLGGDTYSVRLNLSNPYTGFTGESAGSMGVRDGFIPPDIRKDVERIAGEILAKRTAKPDKGGWSTIDPASPEMMREQAQSVAITQVLKARGHDGVIAVNESGFNEYVVFDPAQIKSADAITRDDSGKVIPLSQRFNQESGDIRFSPVRAFHGGPYQFDRFDSGRLGTGVGNHAFGYGLYFASSRDVAEHYRRTLTGPVDFTWRGRTLFTERPGRFGRTRDLSEQYGEDAAFAMMALRQAGSTEGAKDALKKSLKDPTGSVKWIDDNATYIEFDNKRRGQVYEVTLAPNEDEWLDWDKPFSQQSEKVKGILRSAKPGDSIDFSLEELANEAGEDSIETIESGGALYRALDHYLGSKQDASDQLRKLGIPGIRYLDEGSRNAGKGTSNYVVFDDSLVTIEAKFSPRRGEPWVFSRLLHAVETFPAGATKPKTGQQWKSWIGKMGTASTVGPQWQGGISKEEIEWLGINDWLQDNQRYTREQVAAFLRENQITLEVKTRKDGPDDNDERDMAALKKLGYEVQSDDGETAYLSKDGESVELKDAPKRVQELARRIMADGPTQYVSRGYVTPGGTNHREITISMPPKGETVSVEKAKAQIRKALRLTPDEDYELSELQTVAEIQTFVRGMDAFTPELGMKIFDVLAMPSRRDNIFTSSHFPEPNIVVHYRVNDRKRLTYTQAQIDDIGQRLVKVVRAKSESSLGSGAPGMGVERGVITPLEAAQYSHAKGFRSGAGMDHRKAFHITLHIDEIQSDWMQKGRDKGFKKPIPESEIAKFTVDEPKERWEIRRAGEPLSIEEALDLVAGGDPVFIERRFDKSIARDMDDIRRARIGSPGAKFYKVASTSSAAFASMSFASEAVDKMNDNGQGPALAVQTDGYGEVNFTVRDGSGNVIATPPKSFLGSAETPEAALKFIQKQARDGILGGPGAVPDAPFKEAYAMLGFKHALRYAVDSGHDRITWTVGQTQIDRYNEAMRQNVDRITVEPVADYRPSWKTVDTGNGPGHKIEAYKNGNGVFSERVPLHGTTSVRGHSDISLEDVIGKELATKVRAAPDQEHEFTGTQLSIGGHGMKEFYDVQLPAKVQKYVAKWGGKVEKGTLDQNAPGPTIAPEIGTMPEHIAQGYAGAEYFPGDEKPLYASTKVLVNGREENVDVVVDGSGIAIILEDGSEYFSTWKGMKYPHGGESRTAAKHAFKAAWEDAELVLWKDLANRMSDRTPTIRPIGSESTTPVWSLDITPAMRRGAKKPQPMLSPARQPAAQEGTYISLPISGRDTPLMVIKNPTPRDYQHMINQIMKEFDLRTREDARVRHTVDQDGNKYIWSAWHGTHHQVEPELEKKFGGRYARPPFYSPSRQPPSDDDLQAMAGALHRQVPPGLLPHALGGKRIPVDPRWTETTRDILGAHGYERQAMAEITALVNQEMTDGETYDAKLQRMADDTSILPAVRIGVLKNLFDFWARNMGVQKGRDFDVSHQQSEKARNLMDELAATYGRAVNYMKTFSKTLWSDIGAAAWYNSMRERMIERELAGVQPVVKQLQEQAGEMQKVKSGAIATLQEDGVIRSQLEEYQEKYFNLLNDRSLEAAKLFRRVSETKEWTTGGRDRTVATLKTKRESLLKAAADKLAEIGGVVPTLSPERADGPEEDAGAIFRLPKEVEEYIVAGLAEDYAATNMVGGTEIRKLEALVGKALADKIVDQGILNELSRMAKIDATKEAVASYPKSKVGKRTKVRIEDTEWDAGDLYADQNMDRIRAMAASPTAAQPEPQNVVTVDDEAIIVANQAASTGEIGVAAITRTATPRQQYGELIMWAINNPEQAGKGEPVTYPTPTGGTAPAHTSAQQGAGTELEAWAAKNPGKAGGPAVRFTPTVTVAEAIETGAIPESVAAIIPKAAQNIPLGALESWAQGKTDVEPSSIYEQYILRPNQAQAVERSYLTKRTRTFMDDMNLTFRQLVEQHYSDQKRTKTQLANAIRDELGLKPFAALIVANAVDRHMEREMEAQRQKSREAFKKMLQNIRPGRKLRRDIDELIRLVNLGVLERHDITNEWGKLLGIPAITPEILAGLATRAEAIKKAPDAVKQYAVAEMIDFIEQQMPPDKWRMATTYMYANLLSGHGDDLRNVVGNLAGDIMNMVSIANSNWKAAPMLFAGTLRRMQGVPGEVIAALKGEPVVRTAGKIEYKGEMKFGSRLANLISGTFHIPFRMLTAADMMAFKPQAQRYAEWFAFQKMLQDGVPYLTAWRQAVDSIHGTAEERARWLTEANNTFPASSPNKRRRAFEDIRLRAASERAPEAVAFGQKTAAENTLNTIPENAGFGIYHHLMSSLLNPRTGTKAQKAGMRLFGTWVGMFSRIATNMAIMNMSYLPGIGAGMAINATDATRKRILWSRQRQGLYAAIALFLMDKLQRLPDDDDDEEKRRQKLINPPFAIYGAGPVDTPTRNALRKLGWSPYTMKIGERYWKYQVAAGPLAFVFTAIGVAMDHDRGWKLGSSAKTDALGQSAHVLMGVVKAFTEMSFLSGVSQFFTAIANADLGDKPAKAVLVSQMNKLFPASAGARTFKEFGDANVYETDSMYADMVKSFPFAADAMGLKPRLDLFGEPITRQGHGEGFWKHAAGIFTTGMKRDPLVEYLVANNAVWHPRQQPNDMHPDDFYEATKATGQTLRMKLEAYRVNPKNKDKTPDQIEDEIADIVSETWKVERAKFARTPDAVEGGQRSGI